MANICEKCVKFLVGALEIRYNIKRVSSTYSRFFVRLGLGFIRIILRMKTIAIQITRVFSVVLRPIIKIVMMIFFVPIYRVIFASRRQIIHWYKPAKNRVMFFVTNRAVMHVVMFAVVAGTAAINLGMDSVRAETLDAFNKSLAYAVITQEESPFVEEYADMDLASLRSDATSYLSHASLSAPLGSIEGQTVSLSSSASFAGGGALAVPILADSSASVAPRNDVESYIVSDGDTISTIASKFGISVNTVLWANDLTVRSVLKPGQTLTILPTSGVIYTVKSGDTLLKIASTYNAESADILSANELFDSSAIVIGEKLIIPGGTPPSTIATKPTTSSVRSVFVATPSTSGTASAGSSTARMLWPSDGHYIVRGLSWYHTGVDIDCDGHADGTSMNDNYAASDGIVQYAGWKSGYGYVVEINHGNGLMTRYGHHHSLYVSAGQTIAAGTPIGRCGSTGNSTGTHLHFEVIGSKSSRDFRNPLEYIR